MDSRLYNVLTFVICKYIINVEMAKRKKGHLRVFFLKIHIDILCYYSIVTRRETVTNTWSKHSYKIETGFTVIYNVTEGMQI